MFGCVAGVIDFSKGRNFILFTVKQSEKALAPKMNTTTTLRNVGYSKPNETFQKTDSLRNFSVDNYEAVKKGGS
jgi:hypothetical protein